MPNWFDYRLNHEDVSTVYSVEEILNAQSTLDNVVLIYHGQWFSSDRDRVVKKAKALLDSRVADNVTLKQYPGKLSRRKGLRCLNHVIEAKNLLGITKRVLKLNRRDLLPLLREEWRRLENSLPS